MAALAYEFRTQGEHEHCWATTKKNGLEYTCFCLSLEYTRREVTEIHREDRRERSAKKIAALRPIRQKSGRGRSRREYSSTSMLIE